MPWEYSGNGEYYSMTEIIATARHIHQSPQKVRLVVNSVKSLPLNQALAQLSLSRKRAGKFIEKLLRSAIANAGHNYEIKEENLKIKEIQVGPARTLRRTKPRAKGRADVMRKRSCHIRVILTEK